MTGFAADRNRTERRESMGARNKLNAAYVNGAVIVAGLIGLLIQSWRIFVIALIVLLIGGLLSGGIRPQGRKR